MVPNEIQLPFFLRCLQRFEFPHKLGVCERLFSSSLTKNGICWVRTAAGPVWKLDLSNSTHRWIVYGYYEGSMFFRWLRRSLPNDAVIVDSGANIGQMALYFGTYFPEGQILAFEPGEYQANWLCECLAKNPRLPVTVFRKGLGASETSMYLEKAGHGSSHGAQNIVTHEAIGDPIQMAKLADVLTSEGILRVDLWKLDVEGSELAALAGAHGWLEAGRIHALWIETMGDNGRHIIDFMRSVNYRACFLDYAGREKEVYDRGSNYTLFLAPR